LNSGGHQGGLCPFFKKNKEGHSPPFFVLFLFCFFFFSFFFDFFDSSLPPLAKDKRCGIVFLKGRILGLEQEL